MSINSSALGRIRSVLEDGVVTVAALAAGLCYMGVAIVLSVGGIASSAFLGRGDMRNPPERPLLNQNDSAAAG